MIGGRSISISPGVAAALCLYVLVATVAVVELEPAYALLLAAAPAGAALLLASLREPLLPLWALALNVTIFPKDQVLVDLGLALTMDRLLIGLLAAGLVLRLRSGGWRAQRVPLAAPMLALLVLAGIGLLHSLRPLEALLQQFYNLVAGLVVLWGCGELVESERQRRAVAWTLCVSAAYVASLGLWESWTGRYIFPYEALHHRGGWLRAASTFANPVPFGAYLASVVPLGWVLARTARGRGGRALGSLCLLLLLAGLTLSFSRQAYLALGAAVLVMAAAGRAAAPLVLGLAACGLAAVTSSGLWLGPVLSIFFDWDGVSNILHRLYMSRVALQLMLEQPLLGAGLGSFRELAFAVQPFGGLKTPHYGQHPSTHNSYLTFGAELGLPGLLAYGALLGLALARALRAERTAAGAEQSLQRALLGGIVAYCVGALFLDSHEYLGLSTVLFFLVGLGREPRGSAGSRA
jgi:hypothetical protein